MRTSFPHELAAGVSWSFHPRWTFTVQADWINWADSFDELPVRLRDGDNSAVNAAVDAAFQEGIPLHWRNRFVYRTGLEYALFKNLFLRAGYAYGGNPVPDETLTPLTGAIMEHLISAGAGLEFRSWTFDAPW